VLLKTGLKDPIYLTLHFCKVIIALVMRNTQGGLRINPSITLRLVILTQIVH
jgi:hypothetical protein